MIVQNETGNCLGLSTCGSLGLYGAYLLELADSKVWSTLLEVVPYYVTGVKNEATMMIDLGIAA